MSMPPYLRFPQNETIQQKIWSFRPINPTCGRISLEKGTKLFAWINLVFAGLGVVLFSVLLLTMVVSLSNHPTNSEILKRMKQGPKNGQTAEDFVDKIYTRQSIAVFITALVLLTMVSFALMWLYIKLKRAVVERDVPSLKKCFLIILAVEAFFLLTMDIETEIISAKFLLFDVPYMIYKIMGLIFTYSYISSLVNPDNSQSEDLNRIQFSP